MGPCHHGIACPQATDGGVSSDKEDSYKYTELAVADNINMGLGPGLIICYDLHNGKGIRDLVHGMLEACICQVPLQQQPRN